MSEPPITNHQSPAPADGSPVAGEETNALDLAIVLAKHKKIVIGFPFCVALVVAAVSMFLPFTYTAATKILPPQQNQSSALAMLAQLGAQLGSLAGGALGIKNPNELYVAMLKSRPVADGVIARFKLHELYEQKLMVETRQVLEGKSKFSSGKDGIITIEVTDRDPKRSAEIANAYVEELYKLTQTLAITEAAQRRVFFENQLALARTNLANAESAAQQGLEKGGLVVIDAQGRGMVETTARLRGQISVKEIQISAMRSFAADRNPDLQQAQYELEAMKRELARIEGSAQDQDAGKGPGKPGGIRNIRLLRDVKYYETIFELLARQYELAKLDEARDTPLIQVVEAAIVPERRSSPKRAQMVILATLVAGFLAVLWVFAREAGEKILRNPQQAERLNRLKHHILSR